ncbi:hypothetical protein AVEN_179343-1 [Araneus ventricosus]|uniref:DUF7041 domain-containing protein n=1 Tax=Araneus ventricosus TaxID=182803 RepID=A0A4Y2H228_ARAVE|nr:hypothetical protein AVEN_179343-1 [Araneus ventricosus]
MPNDQSANIARVAVKAPPFWRANPALWFRQMESQFTLAGVTSEITKFHHIVAALQSEELEVVGDIILNPPADEPYDALRKRLCSQYADSKEQRLRDLISGMPLGDRKPFRLLLEIRSKAENKISEELLKSLFLQRLPSVIPPSTSKQHCQKSELQLLARNGIEISSFGRLLFKLDLGLRRAFQWPFVIAKVLQPIIGADFLRHFGLLVDIRQVCLINPLTKLQSRGTLQCGKCADIKTIKGDTEFHRLLSEFPSLTEASSTRQAKHDINHCIQTTGPPVFSRPRRLPPDKLKAAKQEF